MGLSSKLKGFMILRPLRTAYQHKLTKIQAQASNYLIQKI